MNSDLASRRNLGNVLRPGPDPERIALIDLSRPEPRTYSYGRLDELANRVAAGLRQMGVAPGSSVGILGPNSCEYLLAKLGILRAGLVAVPVNHRLPPESISDIARDSEFQALFAAPDVPRSIGRQLPRISLEPEPFMGFLQAEGSPPFEPDQDAIARILYTSGSTGKPKGVELSHASQWAIVDGMSVPSARRALAFQRGIVAAPLFHMNALVFSECLFHLRGSVVLLPRFRADPFIRALAEYRVNVITGVPTMLALMAQEKELLESVDLGCVKVVYIGSAPLSDLIVEQACLLFPEAAILNGYGTTETGAGTFGAHPEDLPRPPLSIGYPGAHVEVRLVGGSGPDRGVLEIRTPSRMTRYRNLPELTRERIRHGWINTGDIMRRDENGFFFFVGRADDMFNCSGENIYPGEVERMLERHPDVLEVCVVPRSDSVRGQVPVAFLVKRPGAELSESEIQDFVLAQAAPHLYPRKVFFLDKMPLAGTNKIDRRRLEVLAAKSSS